MDFNLSEEQQAFQQAARAFAQGLARGGYATDPAYAAKLERLATKLQRSED